MVSDPAFSLVDELDRAGVEFAPAVARGFLVALDQMAEQHAPAGDLGRFGDASIERACGWTREPGTLVPMLVRAGVLAVHELHRLVLVGWWERADAAVHNAVARARRFFGCGRAPKLGQLPSRERQEIAAWYEQHQIETESDRAETAVSARSGQLLLFSSSSLRDFSEEDSEEKRDPVPARPRADRAPRAVSDPPGLDEAIQRARAASATYGRPFGEIVGARRALAIETMREQPKRGLDALAQCVHGYWALRGKPNAKWDPLEHLQPQTVWKAEKRGGYLDAYDEALARGLRAPFGRAGPHRAPVRDVAWCRSAQHELAERCAALRAVALATWRDADRAEHESQIFAARGTAAIERGDKRAFGVVLGELAEDLEAIQQAEPMAAAGGQGR